MTNYKNIVAGSSISLVVGLFATAAFAFAPTVYAADLSLDSGWYPESIDSYSSFSGGDSGWYPESIDSYSSYNGGWYPESIDSYSPYSTPSYFGGGWTPSFSTGGGWFTGGSSGYSSPGYTNTNTNVNTNTCTSGSCNTAINAPTNIVVSNPAPTPTVVYNPPVYTPPVYYPPTQYDVCLNIAGIQSVVPSGYYVQNNYCYFQNQPVAYNNAPYVTLSQVPYTGLDLGPWGTAAYWGFLALWCLAAAYLIAVKKVQNKIAAWFMHSTPAHTVHHVPTAHPVAHAHKAHAPLGHSHTGEAAHQSQHSGIDSFIQSQIHRTK